MGYSEQVQILACNCYGAGYRPIAISTEAGFKFKIVNNKTNIIEMIIEADTMKGIIWAVQWFLKNKRK